jgi:serum/glucocorticoid-regulated kinase 2
MCLGYLLVADFGLAKFVTEGELANSFCGTAEYLAPEMLIGNGHDYTIDWWALGILIYEMIVGIPPFFHKNKNKMYHFIKESKVNFPDPDRHKIFVSDDAKDIILRLLDKNKRTRLGANGVEEIMAHRFFADINIEKLMSKQLVPPYKPTVSEDLAYFDPKLTQQTGEITESILPAQQRAIINAGQHNFKGFSSS